MRRTAGGGGGTHVENNIILEDDDETDDDIDELMEDIKETQLDADTAETLANYMSRMRAIERFIGRKLFQDPRDSTDNDHFQPISGDELLRFFAFKRRDNPNIERGTLSGYKSAARKLRILNNVGNFSEDENKSISRFLKGVKNQKSRAVRNGDVESEDAGSRHLKYEEYFKAALYGYQRDLSKEKYGTEAHLGLLMCWNLLARGDTASNIHSLHLDWECDSLKIGIAKSKRATLENAIYYHCFANPLNPSLCIVLSLAIHCACNMKILQLEKPLFHESKSDNKGLPKLITRLLNECGVVDIVNHGVRKGGITKLCCGTPDVCPFAAVQVRCRWKVGSLGSSATADSQVTKRYIKFDQAADCLCGRMLAGLDLQSGDFLALPPYFVEPEDEFVQTNIRAVFGAIRHEKIKNVAPFLLASIVFHLPWLKQNLRKNHPFWKSGIKNIRVQALKELRLRISTEKSQTIFPRGIPMGPILFNKLEIQEQKIASLQSIIDRIAVDQSKLVELVPLSAAASGMMCGEAQLNALKNALTAEISSGFERLNATAQSSDTPTAEEDTKLSNDGYPVYNWSGKFRFIPKTYMQDFDQSQQMQMLWRNWWCGTLHHDEPIRPLRQILQKHRDDVLEAFYFNLKEEFTQKRRATIQKYLTEMVFVMKWFEAIWREKCGELKLDSLNPRTNLNDLETQSIECWKIVWPAAEAILNSVCRSRKGQSTERKRRKHDLSTCGYRTLCERMRLYDKENQE
jgi:hypothetical protein